MARAYDVIVWGATGFTGKLTCKYINLNYPELKWAIAGRNIEALSNIKSELKLKDSVAILKGDLKDKNSMLALATKTKVILTTAGPYAKIGTPVVEACIQSKTHYCDLTGEGPWVRKIVDAYHDSAEEAQVKIVNCCGFDCIPADLSTQMLVEEMLSRELEVQEVRFTMVAADGGASGGTIASALGIMNQPFSELAKLSNPFFLNPRESVSGDFLIPDKAKNTLHYAKSCDNVAMGYDEVLKCWTMPYIMQFIDTRIVNRSNALMGFEYGENFVYTERMKAPNAVVAVFAGALLPLFSAALLFPWVRSFVSWLCPAGTGPTETQQENGFFNVKLWGKGLDKSGKESIVMASVVGKNGDPGYKQTAKMISEAAICLALDENSLPRKFGVLTPSVAMGINLRNRLHKSGMEFKILGNR